MIDKVAIFNVMKINIGLGTAKKCGRIGGRPRAIPQVKMYAMEALNNGMSKAAVCRTFDVKRSTLINTINRLA